MLHWLIPKGSATRVDFNRSNISRTAAIRIPIQAPDGEKALTTLGESWRSRAELVRITSDVFAPAFAQGGIPADRVRLEPAKLIAEARDTLGPVVEGWRLEGRRVVPYYSRAGCAANINPLRRVFYWAKIKIATDRAIDYTASNR